MSLLKLKKKKRIQIIQVIPWTDDGCFGWWWPLIHYRYLSGYKWQRLNMYCIENIIPTCDGFFDLNLGLQLEQLLFDLHLQRNVSQHLLMCWGDFVLLRLSGFIQSYFLCELLGKRIIFRSYLPRRSDSRKLAPAWSGSNAPNDKKRWIAGAS